MQFFIDENSTVICSRKSWNSCRLGCFVFSWNILGRQPSQKAVEKKFSKNPVANVVGSGSTLWFLFSYFHVLFQLARARSHNVSWTGWFNFFFTDYTEINFGNGIYLLSQNLLVLLENSISLLAKRNFEGFQRMVKTDRLKTEDSVFRSKLHRINISSWKWFC